MLCGQSGYNTDSLIALIKKSPSEKAEELEEQVIAIMYTASYDSAKALSEKLLRISPGINNNSLYIKTLIHSYRFHNYEDKIRMLNNAQNLAAEEDNAYLLSAAYEFKAIAFRDNSMTDSAMYYALKAKDALESLAPRYEMGGVLQMIADLHYYAGAYDEAEKTYRLILAEITKDKNSWRLITLNNNIGLIRIKQHRYAEAEEIFKESLRRLSAKKMNYADSSGLPYLYRKLLEVTLNQKKYTEAETYFILGEQLSYRFQQKTELPGLYTSKGTLCFEQGKTDSALYFFNKAEEFDRYFPDYGNQVNIYGGLAKTYSLLKNDKRANDYLLLLVNAKNKSDSVFFRARYMNTFAEYNYNNYLREIKNYESRQALLLTIISVVTLSLLVIGYLYVKINRANKKLVRKNIEVVSGHIHQEVSQPDPAESEIKTPGEADDAKIASIVKDLEQLMTNNKLYLDKDISLGKIADLLGTNRSYLSKAINSAYNVNFATYINDMRIKEAIHLISSGELQHLNMEGIAEKCGFSNRVSFTKAFQKFTGVSPSFFIKNANT